MEQKIARILSWWPRIRQEAEALWKLQPWERYQTALVSLSILAPESGGDPKIVGDAGHSIGLFQMHDQGAGYGLTIAQREDPETQFQHMRQTIFPAIEKFLFWGYRGRRLAEFAGHDAQKCAEGAQIAYGNWYEILAPRLASEDPNA